jgi:hypothetical protein
MATDNRPRHPLTKRFVPDPHSAGRALMAKHVKQVQAAPRPSSGGLAKNPPVKK